MRASLSSRQVPRALRPSAVARAPFRPSAVVRSGDHHAPTPGTGIYAPKYGFQPYVPSRTERFVTQLLGGFLWLWIAFRFKQDGLALIGLRNPMQEFEDEWQAILLKESDERLTAKGAAASEEDEDGE